MANDYFVRNENGMFLGGKEDGSLGAVSEANAMSFGTFKSAKDALLANREAFDGVFITFSEEDDPERTLLYATIAEVPALEATATQVPFPEAATVTVEGRLSPDKAFS